MCTFLVACSLKDLNEIITYAKIKHAQFIEVARVMFNLNSCNCCMLYYNACKNKILQKYFKTGVHSWLLSH